MQMNGLSKEKGRKIGSLVGEIQMFVYQVSVSVFLNVVVKNKAKSFTA